MVGEANAALSSSLSAGPATSPFLAAQEPLSWPDPNHWQGLGGGGAPEGLGSKGSSGSCTLSTSGRLPDGNARRGPGRPWRKRLLSNLTRRARGRTRKSRHRQKDEGQRRRLAGLEAATRSALGPVAALLRTHFKMPRNFCAAPECSQPGKRRPLQRSRPISPSLTRERAELARQAGRPLRGLARRSRSGQEDRRRPCLSGERSPT